eukprot:scaffold4641_cov117-Isochrysis_galbana.AAC.4
MRESDICLFAGVARKSGGSPSAPPMTNVSREPPSSSSSYITCEKASDVYKAPRSSRTISDPGCSAALALSAASSFTHMHSSSTLEARSRLTYSSTAVLSQSSLVLPTERMTTRATMVGLGARSCQPTEESRGLTDASANEHRPLTGTAIRSSESCAASSWNGVGGM